MRLIDADAFKKYLTDGIDGLILPKDQAKKVIAITRSFLKDIDEQPTVERPHGEWEVIGRETFSPTVTYRCSVCKAKEVSCIPNDKPHYCENCGAIMKKKEGEQK